MKWGDWHKKILWRLKDGGLSTEGCAFAVSMIFGRRIYSVEVDDVWRTMDERVWNRKMRAERAWKLEQTSVMDKRADNIVSCLLHHADLLRAGHTSKATEYTIGTDGAPQILSSTRATQSYCGSPSATCAEHA